MTNNKKVGSFIQELRKKKSLTQAQLGEKLNVSFQAVSKWERGESLPEITLLKQLSEILETNVDSILNGGKILLEFKKSISPKDIKKGIDQLGNISGLLGKNNRIYKGLVKGINHELKADIEECLLDSFKRDALIAEILVQNISEGADVDFSQLGEVLQHQQWFEAVMEYARKFGAI